MNLQTTVILPVLFLPQYFSIHTLNLSTSQGRLNCRETKLANISRQQWYKKPLHYCPVWLSVVVSLCNRDINCITRAEMLLAVIVAYFK